MGAVHPASATARQLVLLEGAQRLPPGLVPGRRDQRQGVAVLERQLHDHVRGAVAQWTGIHVLAAARPSDDRRAARQLPGEQGLGVGWDDAPDDPTTRAPAVPYTPEEETRVAERLRALGYLE